MRVDTERFAVKAEAGAVLRIKSYRCESCGLMVKVEERVLGVTRKGTVRTFRP